MNKVAKDSEYNVQRRKEEKVRKLETEHHRAEVKKR